MEAVGEKYYDRLDTATLLIKVLLAVSVTVLALIISDAILRSSRSPGPAATVFRATGLSAPAFLPSGRPGRYPEMADRRVDSRFTPFLPLPDPDPVMMIYRGERR